MEKKIFIQTGTGVNLHGQDVNQASERAINNAIQSNSMPGIQDALPNQDLNNMKVNVKLGIPRDLEDLDEERIKKANAIWRCVGGKTGRRLGLDKWYLSK